MTRKACILSKNDCEALVGRFLEIWKDYKEIKAFDSYKKLSVSKFLGLPSVQFQLKCLVIKRLLTIRIGYN